MNGAQHLVYAGHLVACNKRGPGNTRRIAVAAAQVINGDMGSISIGVQPEAKFVNDVLRYGSSRYAKIMEAEEARKALAERLVDAPTGPVTLTERNFDQAVQKYPMLVVDCWAEWCSPCRMVAPVIEELARDYQGQIVLGKAGAEARYLSGEGRILRFCPGDFF